MDRSSKERLKPLVPWFVLQSYHSIRIAFTNLAFWWSSVILRGEGHACPVCGQSYRKFLPGGERNAVLEKHRVTSAGRRDNCFCPNCRSKERDRLLYLYLQQSGSLNESFRVLHMAPEPSLEPVFRRLNGWNYTSGDLDPKLAEKQIDLTAIDYSDDTFDLLICNHVLEHIPDDHLALTEIRRVLKPGGKALLSVPIAQGLEVTSEDPTISDPAEMERRFGQRDHVRIYGPDFRSRLEKAGFEVETVAASDFIREGQNAHSLLPGEQLFVGLAG